MLSIVAGGMNAAIEAHNLPLAADMVEPRSRRNGTRCPGPSRNGKVLEFQGKYQESAAVGEKAIKVLPEDRDVVVYLGYDLLHLEKYDELLDLTSQYFNVLPEGT